MSDNVESNSSNLFPALIVAVAIVVGAFIAGVAAAAVATEPLRGLAIAFIGAVLGFGVAQIREMTCTVERVSDETKAGK